MSDQNVLVSSGKCYTAPGQELDASFIPCGNDAFGHQTCCGAGDVCLADGACFGEHGTGYGHMLTYWAGCTDSEYKDAACPQKQVGESAPGTSAATRHAQARKGKLTGVRLLEQTSPG